MQSLIYRNGDAMPALGLGTWKSQGDDVYKAATEAIRLGYRHIDCARIYGNEAAVGRAIAEALEAGAISRDDLWVTSKLWNDCHDPSEVRGALERTLADLKLERLDLYLMHWPVAVRKGGQMPLKAADMISLREQPLASTWKAMEELVAASLCSHIGVSNFSVAKLSALAADCTIAPELNQIEMHPYLSQPGMLEYCAANQVLLTAYSPLGSPDRPAALKGSTEPVLLDDPVISAVAARVGGSAAQVALAWGMARGTSVIPKSVSLSRLAENLAAAELVLSADDLAELATLDRHRRYIDGSFWAVEGSDYTVASLWDEG